MAEAAKNQFAPDYAIHPGEILEETLEARGMKKLEFAKRCGLSDKTVSQIISGKAPVTPETAIQFERVLGVAAAVWNNLEAFYRLHVAQASVRKKLERRVAWAERFSVAELVRMGLLEKPCNSTDAVEKLLNFFAVGSVEVWETRFKEMSVAYRKSPSFNGAPEAVAAWLRIGEHLADNINTEPYDRKRFISALSEIRKLTTQAPKNFEPEMKALCRRAGVALVLTSELPKTRLSGATRWLTKDKALIMLSLRHKSDDHFWFSFFHEAAHVLLHGKKELFLDDENRTSTNDKEKEADSFSADFLVSERDYKIFIQQARFTKTAIRDFAKRIGIAPGIVVGRLQHEGEINYSWCNDLKRKFELVESRG